MAKVLISFVGTGKFQTHDMRLSTNQLQTGWS